MISITKLFLILFGIFTIVGGVMGYVKAQSVPSLVAGSISGILLIVAGVLLQMNMPMPGLILGGVVSLALLGRFVPAYLKKHEMMPAGIVSILGVIAVVLCIVSFVKK